ncbi:hypothetical protein HMPREF3198_00572 [Winkia neuii]|nr:hypothetical protein HMPREF3198_00572 [Winkia neuii]
MAARGSAFSRSASTPRRQLRPPALRIYHPVKLTVNFPENI